MEGGGEDDLEVREDFVAAHLMPNPPDPVWEADTALGEGATPPPWPCSLSPIPAKGADREGEASGHAGPDSGVWNSFLELTNQEYSWALPPRRGLCVSGGSRRLPRVQEQHSLSGKQGGPGHTERKPALT